MPERHLKQPGFTDSTCGPFTKNKKIIRKFKETRDSGLRDLKDLNRRTITDKVLCGKSFNIAKNPKYDVHQRGLASIFYKFLIKELLV